MKTIEIKIPYSRENFSFYFNTNFNPSIVKYSENRYLVSCHSFRRYKIDQETVASRIADTENNSNHPWYGGPDSNTWWIPTNKGFWGTIFFDLFFDGVNYRVIEVFHTFRNIVDVRLFKLTRNRIYVTGNAKFPNLNFGRDRKKYDLPEASECDNDFCSTMGATMIDYSISNNAIKFIDIEETYPICNNISVINDKNWSVWFYNRLYISYLLVPRHIVIYPTELESDDCVVKSETEISVFERIEDYYDGAVFFSLSTPALPFDEKSYLAVGHVKIVPELINEYDSPAFNFISKHPNVPVHPLDIWYLIYFYTFDPQTVQILKISHAFLPPDAEYGLVFASGLTMFDPDTFIVSYGEGDVKMKLMLITKAEIESMLFTTDISPNEYRFLKLNNS